MTRAAILLADGFEVIEALTVTDVLRRAGVEATNVSCAATLEVETSQHIKLQADTMLDLYDFSTCQWIITPGGLPGATNLRDNARVCALLQEFMENKHVASICASPYILGELNLLKGYTATCYPGFESSFPAGTYVEEPGVYVSKNLVTASGMGWSLPFALAILREAEGEGAVERVRSMLALPHND